MRGPVPKSLFCIGFACLAAMPAQSAVASFAMTEASVASIQGDAACTQNNSTPDRRLRSAFLLRRSESALATVSRDAGSIRRELQTHFDAVIELLQRNAAQSIEIAAARLEADGGVRWTVEERQRQRRRLSAERDLNIARLKAYRDRGVFPLNEGHAAHPVPIFVDEHNTACAVGHLMRCSGWHSEVAGIAASDLMVYVPDVDEGPLRDWVLTSGLTQEEAALIQPGYAPPIATAPMSDLSGTGASFSADAHWFDGTNTQTLSDGLVYENFLWGALVPTGSGDSSAWQFHTPATPHTDPDPQHFGPKANYESVSGRTVGAGACEFCDSTYYAGMQYANIMTIAPDADSTEVAGAAGETRYFWMSFDVVSPDPALAIDQVGVWLAPGFNFGTVTTQTLVVTSSTQVGSDQPIYLPGQAPMLVANPIDGDPLGELHAANLFGDQGGLHYEDIVGIEPRDRVTVHTLVSVGSDLDSAQLGGLSHTVHLVSVPEPVSMQTVVALILGFLGRFRQSGSRRI